MAPLTATVRFFGALMRRGCIPRLELAPWITASRRCRAGAASPLLLSGEMNDFDTSSFLLQVFGDDAAVAMIGCLFAAHSMSRPY
jgi:hypothetical protein